MKPDSVLAALHHVWDALVPLNQPMALMGGLAVTFWDHLRATRDVDLLIGVSADSQDRLLDTLAAAGIRRKQRDRPVLTIGTTRIIQLLCELPGVYADVQIDLLLADTDYQQEALRRRISGRFSVDGPEISVLACEDLILHKLLAGRILDRADVIALLRANWEGVDASYLDLWAARLGVAWDLAECREEASGDPAEWN